MELKFEVTKSFEKSFEKLPAKVRKAIMQKISAVSTLKGLEVFRYVIQLASSFNGLTHKIRCGNYRILLTREGSTFYFMTITDRKETYK